MRPKENDADQHGRRKWQRASHVELESFSPVDTPRYVIHGEEGLQADHDDPRIPIPEAPLHQCPTCDYILTGLISRRCPECGEEFALSEARRRGFELSEEMRESYRWLRNEKIMLAVGLFLMVIGFALPWFSYTPGLGWPVITISRRGWIMVYLIPEMLLVWMILRVYFGTRWLHIVFATGLLSAFVGLLLVI